MENKVIKKIRKLQGKVVSDKMDKTVVVDVLRLKKHPIYKKRYPFSKKFKAHDEGNIYKVGDEVIISETKPKSREKKWEVVSKAGVLEKVSSKKEESKKW